MSSLSRFRIRLARAVAIVGAVTAVVAGTLGIGAQSADAASWFNPCHGSYYRMYYPGRGTYVFHRYAIRGDVWYWNQQGPDGSRNFSVNC
jgi:hypothetical protein